MSTLSAFFIELSQNPELARQFNAGSNDAERLANRCHMLQQAGVSAEQAQQVASMSEPQLRDQLGQELADANEQWRGLNLSFPNSNNTDNKLGLIGKRQPFAASHARN